MSTASIETSPKSKRGATKKVSDPRKSNSAIKSAPIGKPAKNDVPPSEGCITKQERVLALLNRSSGASVEDIMEATAWQQHSVRGFLAGTVKKKLGLDLASSKTSDEARRYRIVTRRGR